MRRKFLAGFLSLCLALSLLPMSALAVGETTTPTIQSITISDSHVDANANGCLIATVDEETTLAGEEFSLVTSEAVTFVEDSNPASGSLYVASASTNAVTLAFAFGTDEDTNSISMTSTDGVTWTGSFSDDFELTMAGLAQALSAANTTLAAGAMKSTATQTNSAAYRLYCNQDSQNAYVVVCPTTITLYTVTYTVSYGENVDDTVLTWTVPSGSALTAPELELLSTQTLGAWYYDAGQSEAVTFGVAVTGNLSLYATVTTTTTGSFATDFAAHKDTLTISTDEDWDSFISLASQISSTQLVVLDKNIDCENTTYTPLTFAGNFDGKNHTISNATFSAVDGYSGMFKTIGADQKICNLILNNITAKYASTYSGILAGAISGTEGHNALVQNVKIVGGSASGRSAGGIAGFIFWADVKYCATYDTTITGVANGGGIGGISYGFITQCCSDTEPTALLSSGKGGIAGKNLEGGTITSSWCTYNKVVGTSTSATESNVLPNATADSSFSSIGLETTKWTLVTGKLPTLNMENCRYDFSA